jgi:hypothetical protein
MGFGSAIGGAIGGIAGAIINKRSADKQHNFMTNQYWNDVHWRKEMATSGIQKRVKDAKAAGIHPLAALGAQVGYGSPASVGTAPVADMSSMGQNIGRAVAATATNHERKMMDLQLENQQLDNDMKRLQVTSERRRLSGQIGPGMPDDVKNQPAIVTSHSKDRFHQEAGSVTSVGYARTPDGGLTPVPSKDVKERIEDQWIPETVWAAQNYLAPTFGDTTNKPSKKLLPKGANDWQWSIKGGYWKPVKGKGRSLLQRAVDKTKKYRFDQVLKRLHKGKPKKQLRNYRNQ